MWSKVLVRRLKWTFVLLVTPWTYMKLTCCWKKKNIKKQYKACIPWLCNTQNHFIAGAMKNHSRFHKNLILETLIKACYTLLLLWFSIQHMVFEYISLKTVIVWTSLNLEGAMTHSIPAGSFEGRHTSRESANSEVWGCAAGTLEPLVTLY